MTGEQRRTIRVARDEACRAQFARPKPSGHVCSRCGEPVEPADRSPGRYWCRPCENERRRKGWHAARARVVAA